MRLLADLKRVPKQQVGKDVQSRPLYAVHTLCSEHLRCHDLCYTTSVLFVGHTADNALFVRVPGVAKFEEMTDLSLST